MDDVTGWRSARDMNEIISCANAPAESKSTHDRHRATLIAYLQMKVEQQDWHGVSDAANDLRELDARSIKDDSTGELK